MDNSPKKPNERDLYLFAARIFGDFTGVIAIPALLAAILGEYLDTKYHKDPLFLIVLLGLAFVGSGAVIYRKVKTYSQEYKKLLGETNNLSKHD